MNVGKKGFLRFSCASGMFGRHVEREQHGLLIKSIDSNVTVKTDFYETVLSLMS